MSAFEVSDNHINTIMNGWVQRGHSLNLKGETYSIHNRHQITELGQLLVDANCASVNYLYNEATQPDRYEFKTMREKMDPVAVIKLIRCLEYQSCQINGYDRSLAGLVAEELTYMMIEALPGYEEAEWSV